MKFEPWRLDPQIIDVSDDDGMRIGLIQSPHSSQATFFQINRSKAIGINEMLEILSHMEPLPAQQQIESSDECNN